LCCEVLGARQLPGIFQTNNMSRTEFDEFFTSFKVKFPPVESVDHAVLKLSTQEILDTIMDFWPEIELPRTGITRFMTDQGYKYVPEVVNERIRYFWLIGQGQEN
jgi:hypothetical protein